mmetsp:Transcript_9892/g.20997  ORF Transcript_9892/g.20997 Transcript_9892/m.20997 type:complete len:343 (+) Transcript_9892:121-1149(+)
MATDLRLALRAPLQRLVLMLRRLFGENISGKALSMLAGGVLVSLFRVFHELYLKRAHAKAESNWRRHVDFSVVQACMMTTEHLESLGRIEKRTLFVKPVAEVFSNEFIIARVLAAAKEAAATGEPMLVTQLSAEDKWHVLNTCTNHLSSVFAPYHVFFNEARRAESYYRSAWYCFTLTCAQTEASGRWFITPLKPVGVDDIGIMRIRIVLMNEQELREIAAGAVEPPSFGFFNGRHESRWKVCLRFAELFGRQVQQLNKSLDRDSEVDWGANLCGRMGKKGVSHPNLASMGTAPAPVPEYEPQDNAILRIHIPFPITKGQAGTIGEEVSQEDCKSKDVVLFE